VDTIAAIKAAKPLVINCNPYVAIPLEDTNIKKAIGINHLNCLAVGSFSFLMRRKNKI